MLPITPYGFLRAATGLEPIISKYKLDVLPLEHLRLFYKLRQDEFRETACYVM